ncbi:MAG: hypothetical protein K2H66_04520 [Oscillospiraceae bacterium]|nr:hypothetical protein [Oscillospiraceae bacterium]
MQWIILIGNENFNLETIKKIEHYESIANYTVEGIPERYCVDFGKNHIFYDLNHNYDEFEEDIKKVPFEKPIIITATYTEKECIRKVLLQENFPKNIYVDNDLGLIAPIKDYIYMRMPLDEEDMKNISIDI